MSNRTLDLYKEVYSRNVDKLLFFARKFVDEATAEDIVQDIFLKIWQKNTDLSPKEINSYLYTSVRNACFDHIRHASIENNYRDKLISQIRYLELDFYKDPSDILIDRETKIFLDRVVDILPEKCKQVFKMAYFDEIPHADIAAELNISVRTVDNQVYKALKMIRAIVVNQKK
ncbi:RNA polymerase sigma-70 factor [Dysgonomonas sp. 25]|uniref:RNA polymerase sigma-70 factor n=1 Tax=Dysgonomonas sp. 25 TaxID=2302933 RepID=UPI0013D29465|nr:RNA polymerase sigma-70 factor [Dysgonomonas sp. 25]NDV70166.1 RNA polymerase sigma-70 factor [Dysgonomonas sp. 25]